MKKLEVELLRLKSTRDKLKKEGFKFFPQDRKMLSELNEALEHYTILPTNLDPYKVVPKVKHVLQMREKFYEGLIKKYFPNKPKAERRNLETIIQLLGEIEMLYKISRHWFLLGKKHKDLILLYQGNMIIQQVKQIFLQLKDGILACGNGIPIGDSVGPMVARKLGENAQWKEVVHDTVMAEIKMRERKVYIIKARGVGSTVGRVNDALAEIIKKTDAVIMIDAALKGMGDRSGEVIIGEGAAIGGFGVEKFEIEEMATKYNIPLYAVLIKESYNEAIGFMTREIAYGFEVAVIKVKMLIEEMNPDIKTVAIIGVGNTVGVGQ